jgi:hypothetical protein
MRWMMCLTVVAFLGGCDASKPELESTKTTLNNVTNERDQLRAQNTKLQQDLDATRAELAKAKAAPAPAAATAAKPAPAEDAKHPADKAKHAKKS